MWSQCFMPWCLTHFLFMSVVFWLDHSILFFCPLGLVGLMNKNMVSSLISKYAQVVLWFCRTGLLPEGSGKEILAQTQFYFMASVCRPQCFMCYFA